MTMVAHDAAIMPWPPLHGVFLMLDRLAMSPRPPSRECHALPFGRQPRALGPSLMLLDDNILRSYLCILRIGGADFGPGASGGPIEGPMGGP